MRKTAVVPVISSLVALFAITAISRPVDAQASVTFTIVDGGGDPAIPDVIVSGADSGNGTYLDVETIEGVVGQQNTVAVAIDAATTWNLTALNAGTVAIQAYSSITFSGINDLTGAAGEDIFIFSQAFSGTIEGGAGTNTLDYSAYATSVTANLTTHTATGTAGIAYIQNLIGGSGNDTLTGDALENAFTGGPGKDLITGAGGADTIVETRDANFTLTNTNLTIGAEGNDTLSGIEAARLTGGSGNNSLNASTFSGSVVLDGAAGNDHLAGGSAADVLIGGTGDDDLNGGGGNDEYVGGPGVNTVTEALSGGVDTIAETGDVDFALTSAGHLVWSAGTDNFTNVERVHLIGGPGNNHFYITAIAGVFVSMEGEAGYDTLSLDPEGVVASLITDGIVVPGDVPLTVNYQSVEAVIVDGDAVVSADATLNAREYSLASLVVSDNSVLTLASDASATGFMGVEITTSSDLTVTAGSLISAAGQGYAGGHGPGAGATASFEGTDYGGGAGYGGSGGNGYAGAQGGVTYGSAVQPTDLGSGGGSNGGQGGGAIRLVIDGTLLLDGGIACGGTQGGERAGGGSGGSIYLTVGTLAGTGTISADGGDAGEGGGGGAGRIAVYRDADMFSGTITASGGEGFERGEDVIAPKHDSVVLAVRPVTVKLRNGGTDVATSVQVGVRNADVSPAQERPGHVIRLVMSETDCPAGTVGTPDFDRRVDGAQDTVLLAGGRSKKARVPLLISTERFTSLNAAVPQRCRVIFEAQAEEPGNFDPTPENDRVTMELNVIDSSDLPQVTAHESVLDSMRPVTVRLKHGMVEVQRTVRVRVGNADIVPSRELPGHEISLLVADGDCPPGTVGAVDFEARTPGAQSTALVRGGKTARATVSLTIDAARVDSASAEAPVRCTVALTAIGPPGNEEPDVRNNTAKLVIDVLDQNDF